MMPGGDNFDLQDYRSRLAQALGVDADAQPTGEGPSIADQQPDSDTPAANGVMGAGPSIDGNGSNLPPPDDADARAQGVTPAQGAGPTIDGAPPAPQAAGGGVMGSGMDADTPTLDKYGPGSSIGDTNAAPNAQTPGLAPRAPQAPQAPRAPLAAKAPLAAQAPDAAKAPTVAELRTRAASGDVPAAAMISKLNAAQVAQQNQAPTIDGSDQGAAPPPAAPSAPTAASGLPPTGTEADAAPPAPGADATPDIAAGGEAARKPAAEHTNGETTPNGKKGINVHPPDFDPTDETNYNMPKLKALQARDSDPTPSQVFDTMKKPIQGKYMDWWEQQHGDIEQRYNQMQNDIGARPDPNDPPTRQEQFKALMNFGISLLKGAGRGQDQVANAGNAMEAGVNSLQQSQQAKTSAWDTQNANIQAGKAAEEKNIGTYGQAMREDTMIQNDNTRTQIAEAKALAAPKPGQPTTRVLSNGTMVQYDPDSKSWNPAVDKSGKPIGPMPIGAGSKGGAGHVSSMVQQVQDLVNHGVPYGQAVTTVYKIKPSGDPSKTYTSIYNQERRNGADPDEAASTARQQTEVVHGAGALSRQQARDTTTLVPSNQPPPGSVPPGKQVTFKNGSVWKNEHGVLTQVQ